MIATGIAVAGLLVDMEAAAVRAFDTGLANGSFDMSVGLHGSIKSRLLLGR